MGSKLYLAINAKTLAFSKFPPKSRQIIDKDKI